ncbi:transcription factor Dp-1 [Striga asiatica]|uniref:Transcription factor Dp-1 n=1 Tax=Striga asiatica TaxID=4170 RepID=A0A5A7QN07_STRAF|nr:transcription factor Dp-1 [Striga asiatica]
MGRDIGRAWETRAASRRDGPRSARFGRWHVGVRRSAAGSMQGCTGIFGRAAGVHGVKTDRLLTREQKHRPRNNSNFIFFPFIILNTSLESFHNKTFSNNVFSSYFRGQYLIETRNSVGLNPANPSIDGGEDNVPVFSNNEVDDNFTLLSWRGFFFGSTAKIATPKNFTIRNRKLRSIIFPGRHFIKQVAGPTKSSPADAESGIKRPDGDPSL